MTQNTLSDYQGYDCPECDDRSFETPRAFNSHWGQVHDGEPPQDLDTSYGEHSEEHRRNLSEALEGRELSDETARKVSEALSGRTHDPELVEKRIAPQRERIKVPCEWCGDTLHRHKCRLEKHDKQFCDGECHGKWISHNNTGENHPRYNGGELGFRVLRHRISVRSWQNIAEDIRAEYDHECQMCGLDGSNTDRALEVHHIVPLICGGTNHRDNLIPMCMTCHRKAESYTKQFTEPHLLKYANEGET